MTTNTPDWSAALHAIEHNLDRRRRPEAPLNFGDDDGRDEWMDPGEVQDAENRYENFLDRIGVA